MRRRRGTGFGGRPKRQPLLPLLLYGVSVILSVLLFYSTTIYCQFTECEHRKRHYAQLFAVIVAPFLAFMSSLWLLTKTIYSTNSCIQSYNCLEMPSAVFSSLLAGVCAVIEILYSVDFAQVEWSKKWSWPASDAVVLCGVHALLAFSLE